MMAGLKTTLSLFLFCTILLPAAAFAAKDACSLVTSDDAQAALGEPVGPGRSEPRSMAGADGTNCKFRSTQGSALKAKSVSVTVEYSSSDISSQFSSMADSMKSQGYKNVQTISGVGDAAVWGTNSMVGRPTGELTIRKGKSIMLIILISGVADETDALNRAKALAAKVVPKA